MALTEQQRNFLLGVGALGLLVVGAAALNRVAEENSELDELDTEGYRPGRLLELASLGAMDWKHGANNVLDNPSFTTFYGTKLCPDVVVMDDDGVVEVREAKDVAELRTTHVLQAALYDAELVPRKGTTLDIAEDTFVPRDVRRLARSMDIGIKRVRRG